MPQADQKKIQRYSLEFKRTGDEESQWRALPRRGTRWAPVGNRAGGSEECPRELRRLRSRAVQR